jgi:hypothetical protein
MATKVLELFVKNPERIVSWESLPHPQYADEYLHRLRLSRQVRFQQDRGQQCCIVRLVWLDCAHRKNRGMAPARAHAAYQDFLTLWKDADPGVAVLQQAKAEYAKLQ